MWQNAQLRPEAGIGTPLWKQRVDCTLGEYMWIYNLKTCRRRVLTTHSPGWRIVGKQYSPGQPRTRIGIGALQPRFESLDQLHVPRTRTYVPTLFLSSNKGCAGQKKMREKNQWPCSRLHENSRIPKKTNVKNVLKNVVRSPEPWYITRGNTFPTTFVLEGQHWICQRGKSGSVSASEIHNVEHCDQKMKK